MAVRLGEGFGAVCRDVTRAAQVPLITQQRKYLEFLAERSEVEAPENTFHELLTLVDRGVMVSQEQEIEELEVEGEYTAAYQRETGGAGEVAVAVGPAKITLRGDTRASTTSTGNLRCLVRYRSVDRADWLTRAEAALPARPASQLPPPQPTG